MQHKKCAKCGEEKPATPEYFHKGSGNLRSHCKVCRLAVDKDYYEANKEHKKEYGKAYYEANKEYKKSYDKDYREANRERVLKNSAARYRTPKGKWELIRTRAKQRNLDFSLPFELYESKLWGNPCHYCGVDIEVTGLDRKDSNKGYTPDNVVPCCWNCNTKKSAKPYEQFLEEIKKNTCINWCNLVLLFY
jgi:hypothetical protein